MDTMKIKHYLAETSHFIPIGDVPVVAPATCLGDAIALMRSHGTSAALIQRSDLSVDLFSPYLVATIGRPIAESMRVAVADVECRAPLAVMKEDAELDAVRYTRLASGVYASPLHVAGISRGARIIGLLSREEGGLQILFTPALFYQCSNGHIYSPPPPSACPLDGSSIGVSS